METRATAIKAGQRRQKWVMVQAKGRRDMSGERTNSKGMQAGNGDACNSDLSRAKASQVGDGAGDGYGHVS
jgi:hypothetical protein